MIYEYALEPEVLVSWAANHQDYRFALDKFGLGQPRMVAEYPGFENWRELIKKAAAAISLKSENMDEGKLTALFYIFTEKMIKREQAQYDGTQAWLDNAFREHGRFPFHGIVATANPNGYTDILLSSELGLVRDDRWDKPREQFVPRTAEDMSQAIAPMLRICKEVIFIDPHFSPGAARRRYIRSFREFFSVLSQNNNLIRIEVHMNSTINNFEDNYRDQISRIIPRNLRVRFVQLEERPNGPELHDRYIITDIGGLEFSRGLDVGNGEVRISLLSKSSYIKLWYDYCCDNPAFDCKSDFQIDGTC